MILIFLVRHKTSLIFFFLIVIGLFLRFYNLNWGAPFYFHPDERNIASSVSQLRFPSQMNPHFFAYGSFPIYVIYFTGVFVNTSLYTIGSLSTYLKFLIEFSSMVSVVTFEQAIMIARFFSAVLSVFLIPVMFTVGNKLGGRVVGLLCAFFTVFCVGFVQFAHFGTFEIWLTFLSVLLFYFCLKMIESGVKKKYVIACAIVLGLLHATKISSLALIPLPFLAILVSVYKTKKDKNVISIDSIKKILASVLVLLTTSILVYSIFSPFVHIDFLSFKSSMNYESGVALGTLPVFYTGQFFGSIPVVFQFFHVYPFLINPVLVIIFIFAFLYYIYFAIKHRAINHCLVTGFYLMLFLSQAFFFAKWTRYLVPTVPFVFIIIAFVIVGIEKKFNQQINRMFVFILLILVIFSSPLFTLAYITSALSKEDTRVAAAEWAGSTLPADAQILSEVYDMGIVPFNSYFRNITLFNFYDLESNIMKSDEGFFTLVRDYDYIILPSQRVLKSRLQNSEQFPKGNRMYEMLFSGGLGFKEIYRTPCDFSCRVLYINNPIFNLEETATVFDRPTVFIFKKIN